MIFENMSCSHALKVQKLNMTFNIFVICQVG
uniref:Uncharacterized protein n=1 Tax=Setaria italica TaxID=4555 RepID=K3Z1W7_SETIT